MNSLKKVEMRNGLFNFLAYQQQKIDSLNSYKEKVLLAKEMWKNKKKQNAHKSAFNAIEKVLKNRNIYFPGLCNYCEYHIGESIEHIYPKIFFPELTFSINNMLWSCKTCNNDFKSSKFSVFSNGKVVELKKNKQFDIPQSNKSLFLNINEERISEFIKICPKTGVYSALTTNNLEIPFKRATYTIEILGLNSRVNLVESRLKTLNHIKELKALDDEIFNDEKKLNSIIKNKFHTSIWLSARSYVPKTL